MAEIPEGVTCSFFHLLKLVLLCEVKVRRKFAARFAAKIGGIMATKPKFYTKGTLRKSGKTYRAQLRYKDGVEEYIDKDGKTKTRAKWKTITKAMGASTKKAAVEEMNAWREEMERKAGFHNAGELSSFIEAHIDTLTKSKSIAPTTSSTYYHVLKIIKNGPLAHAKVEDLTKSTVQDWVNELNEDYSSATVRKIVALMKGAFNEAVDAEELPYNPIGKVKSPKLDSPEPNALDENNYRRLLTYLSIVESTPTNLAIKMALYTGMREGEICGLQWSNVDLTNRHIYIRKVVSRADNQCFIKEPKTKNSRRDFDIPDELVSDLKQLRADMAGDCMEAGVPMNPNFFVFGKIDGSFMNPHSLWRDWKAIAKSLGLKGKEGKVPTFHDLRHTYATVAIANHVDVKTVQGNLGHSSAKMTLDTYAAADDKAQRDAADKVGRIFAEATKDAEILELKPTGTEQ